MVQRNVTRETVWRFMDYWRGMGKLIVVDLDDAYQMMPWSNPAHAYWTENKSKLPDDPINCLAEGLKRADGLTTPSKQLIDDWAETVPGYWLPNWATKAWYEKLMPKIRNPKEEIVIGWGGSVSHYDSWWGSGIRSALNGICAEFPHVKVKICGNDKRIFDQLPVPESQKIWQTGVPPEKWPEQVNTFDIGVAPLFGPYDQRRSWIKGLEYLLVGIPWVGAAGRPYAEFAEYGTLVEEGTNHWHKALREVIVHYDDHLGRARDNRKIGFHNTLEERIDDYVNIFTKINPARRDIHLPGIAYVGFTPATTGTNKLAALLAR